jgi:hypothetical protein
MLRVSINTAKKYINDTAMAAFGLFSIKTSVVLALAGSLLFGVQPASANQESCDQCKYLRCLKSSLERKQNLIKVYEGLLNFWKAHSTDDNGNPVMVRDLGKLAEPDRTRIYIAVAYQLKEYGSMEESRTAAVPAAQGCGYPDTELSANTDSFETCGIQGLGEAQKLQPCKELAALIAAHEDLHAKACKQRQQPNSAYWRWVYTDAQGTPGEKLLPPKIRTPVGAAAEEIAGYQIEIAGLKAIIEKLKKRCQYRATGQSRDSVLSGVVCDPEKPFDVSAKSSLAEFVFKFVPTTRESGAASYATSYQMVREKGSGTYTLSSDGADGFDIALKFSSTATVLGHSIPGRGIANVHLAPLESTECADK